MLPIQDMTNQTTEQRILEAAEKEFMHKGFNAARTTSIAEAAGVTHAMLHYYFRSKENLFDKVIKDKLTLIRHLMLGSLEASGKSLFERIKETISRHIDFLAANPELPRFIISEVYSQPKRLAVALSVLQDSARNVIQSLQSEIDSAAARGLCRQVSAGMLILDIVSLNIFSFVVAPVVDPIVTEAFGNNYDFLQARKKENIETIMRKLKI